MPTFTATPKEAAGLYKIMNGATQLSTVYLKNQDVTAHEVAVVGERLTQMPGVNLGTDWERSYPNGDSVTSIIGQVPTKSQGCQLTNYRHIWQMAMLGMTGRHQLP